ncbi:hypothetical protein swp_3429 [Shewanella piezotolerans WP3]|uniref:Uncharacterized protein n=1 Tax=Shewanella piezotolerans (strain WP3 / JCM 13877) TaxID=225849 RepID=B8CRX1_SHEPW|nr:hypothetical protein swp_3429 [Shewanella piezotolerans WP3]
MISTRDALEQAHIFNNKDEHLAIKQPVEVTA